MARTGARRIGIDVDPHALREIDAEGGVVVRADEDERVLRECRPGEEERADGERARGQRAVSFCSNGDTHSFLTGCSGAPNSLAFCMSFSSSS